jgi:hypothetical protein
MKAKNVNIPKLLEMYGKKTSEDLTNEQYAAILEKLNG